MKYITIAPRNPKGRWIVARMGAGGQHYYNACESYSEGDAKRMCRALASLDAMEVLDKLEAPPITQASNKQTAKVVRMKKGA
jgi:hypothetical protein